MKCVGTMEAWHVIGGKRSDLSVRSVDLAVQTASGEVD